jgi:hypothetical protein
MFLFQESGQTVGFSPMDLWHNMGIPAKAVVGVLFIMSIWSLAVIIDRALYFSAARKQSREFAPRVAGALKEGKLDEAVKVADRNKKSIWPKWSPLACRSFATMVVAEQSPKSRSNQAGVLWSALKLSFTPS